MPRARRAAALAAVVALVATATACGGLASTDEPVAVAPHRSPPVGVTTPPSNAPSTAVPDATVPAGTTVPAATGDTTPPAPVPVVGPEPVAIRSGAIDLDSAVEHVGLQADDGGVEVPDFALAGWYRFGSRPGQPGPTVIVGHVDSRSGPAVFFRLRDLVPGDTVEIVLADGTTASYAVTGSQQFPKAEFPTFEVFGATEADVLRLVTCTGEFNRDIRSYYDNLVVTAERIA